MVMYDIMYDIIFWITLTQGKTVFKIVPKFI